MQEFGCIKLIFVPQEVQVFFFSRLIARIGQTISITQKKNNKKKIEREIDIERAN